MSKLAESYIEFVAKGLEEVEKGISGLDEGSRTAHKAVSFLSEQFSDFAKKNTQALESTKLQQKAFNSLKGQAEELTIRTANLREAQAKLSVQQAEMHNALLKTNQVFAQSSNAIINLASKERLLGAENTALLAQMQAVDKRAIRMAASELTAAGATERATKELALNAQALQLKRGKTEEAMQANAKLQAYEAKIVTGEKAVELSLLKTNQAFQKQALAIANAASKQKMLAAEGGALVAKMMATNKEAISLSAAEAKASQATDIAAKKLQLEARQLNLATGAFKETTKAAAALAAMEEKIAAKEMKVANKFVKPEKKEAASGKAGEPLTKTAKTAIAIESKGMPQAEKGIAGITARLKGMQMAALVAGGAVAGSVAMLTRSASAGTVEGENLAKSYEVAGKVIGDIFAPYVRLTTELVNKLTSYWMNLSSATKSSIAKWSMVTVAVVAFAAALPTVIASVSALATILAALVSPIGLAGAAVVAMLGYFAGVFDATKSWEEVLSTFIEFFLNAWSRAESAFESFCSGVVSQYGSTVGPLLTTMEEAWNSVSETIGGVLESLGEAVTGFFGTSIEEASTFEGAMSSVVEAWLDLQSAAEAVISALSDGFMWIYDKAVRPTIDLILGAFKTVWDFIRDAAQGIFGSWTEATGGISDSLMGAITFMTSSWKSFIAVGVSMAFTLAETFADVVNKISALWWGMVNKLAKAAAWVLEQLGAISKETADKMREVGKGDTDIFDTTAMRKKMDGYLDSMVVKMDKNKDKAKEIGKAINEFVNPPAGSELADKLESNGKKAKNIAKTVAGMVKGLDKPGGFTIKGTMAFEGIGASFDRLQLAMANNTGVTVEKAQLGQMQQINANMQIAAGALNQIKDKNPAVI